MGCCSGKPEKPLTENELREAAGEEDVGAEVLTDGLTFAPLKYYSGDGDYFSTNKLIRVFQIQEAPGLYRVFFETANLDKVLQNFNLTVFVDGKIQNVNIKYLFPLTGYEIIIKQGKSPGFQIVSAVWDIASTQKLGDYKQFGGFLSLEGTNTIKYVGIPKTIMVFDDSYICTGIYELGWFGTEVINNGAKYYKVVCR